MKYDKVFVIADMHLGHKGVCKFTDENGVKIRPWDDADEMTEDLIELFNETVSPKDKTYFLGDMCINKRYLECVSRLNGDKVLIKGNHDIFDIKLYLKYFRDVRAYHVQYDVIMSHIPVHPCQKSRYKMNIHGHMHENRILDDDSWYHCVYVERTNFKPVLLNDILEKLK